MKTNMAAADATKARNDAGIAGLKIGWLNVQSLRNKTSAIHEIIEERDLDAAILTETWHRSSDDVSLRLAVPTGFRPLMLSGSPIQTTAGSSFSIAAATDVPGYPFWSSRRSRVCVCAFTLRVSR